MLKIIITDEINFYYKKNCMFGSYIYKYFKTYEYLSNILIKTNQVLINNKPYLSK